MLNTKHVFLETLLTMFKMIFNLKEIININSGEVNDFTQLIRVIA